MSALNAFPTAHSHFEIGASDPLKLNMETGTLATILIPGYLTVGYLTVGYLTAAISPPGHLTAGYLTARRSHRTLIYKLI